MWSVSRPRHTLLVVPTVSVLLSRPLSVKRLFDSTTSQWVYCTLTLLGSTEVGVSGSCPSLSGPYETTSSKTRTPKDPLTEEKVPMVGL